ncbi:MAG: PAS domain-containing protein [Rhodospirillaceae bacterium]|nr:PAS domain-containing protein [Rhodospirillaceae bacterium]
MNFIKPDRASFDLFRGEATPAFRSNRVAALYRYWQSRRLGALPQRSDIDPAEIKALLPYVLIVDLHQNPFRVFYRLVGTAVVHFSGMDFTNTYLDELAFDICATADLTRAYRLVSDTRRPGQGMAFAQITHQSALDVEYLICPLGDGQGQVRQCLVIEDYVAREGFEAGRLRLARPV